MNNNWRGNGEAVFTFSGPVGRRTDSVPHSRLSELITEHGGEGRVAGRPGGRGQTRKEAELPRTQRGLRLMSDPTFRLLLLVCEPGAVGDLTSLCSLSWHLLDPQERSLGIHVGIVSLT